MQKGHVAVRWQRQQHNFSEHSEPWAEADANTCPQGSPWEEPWGWAGGARPPPACWLLPSSEHSTQRLSPTHCGKSQSHLHCLAAAPLTQHTIQGRHINPPLWNHRLLCAPCSISSQKQIEVHWGKTSFVLHLAQETGTSITSLCNASPFWLYIRALSPKSPVITYISTAEHIFSAPTALLVTTNKRS